MGIRKIPDLSGITGILDAQTGYFPVTTKAHDEQTFKDNIAQYPQFQTESISSMILHRNIAVRF